MKSHFLASNKSKTIAIVSLVAGALAAVVGIASFSQLQTQYSILQFLPSHHAALETDFAVRKKFHLADKPLFLGLVELPDTAKDGWLTSERMKRLQDFTQKIQHHPGVAQVVSLANVEGVASVDQSLSVGTLTSVTPQSEWANRILQDHLLTPSLITPNALSVVLYVQLVDENVSTMLQFETDFKKLLASDFSDAKTSVGGVPAVQTDLGLLLSQELKNFLLLTLLACAITLVAVFKTRSTLIIPMSLTIFANIMVVAMMAWTGLAFTILSATIPILVFITVMSLATHILLRVHEDAKVAPSELTRWQLVVRANRAIWLPNLLGALTTCVGFLTLLTSDVPLIRNYGFGVGAAVILSWFLTSVGIVPFLLLLPLPEPRDWVSRPARWALLTMQKKRTVVTTVLVACAALIFVGRHLDWTGRLFDDLPEGQATRMSTENIDRDMGGVIPFEVVVNLESENAWRDPAKIASLDELVQEIRKTEGVGSAQSIGDFLRLTSQQKNSRLPASKAEVGEGFFLYSMSADDPMQTYLINEGKSLRIGVRLHDLPSDKMESVVADIKAKVAMRFPEAKIELGGMGAVIHMIQNQLSSELIFGFWQALAVIVFALMVIFKSLRWALVACLPNLVPPVALLGYLALTHTPIKPGVAIIFSIALGLAFNNTVYLLNRIHALKKSGRSLQITRAFYLEGNPCLVSTLIVMMGFSVFLFSYFPLNHTFGVCMLVSIVGGIVGDLIFLPALLKLVPRLLEGKIKTQMESSSQLQPVGQVLAFARQSKSSQQPEPQLVPLPRDQERAS